MSDVNTRDYGMDLTEMFQCPKCDTLFSYKYRDVARCQVCGCWVSDYPRVMKAVIIVGRIPHKE